MQYLYIALETEGKEVLGVIGFYSSYSRALERCRSEFIMRGYDYTLEREEFEYDYEIKKYVIDEHVDIPLKSFKYEKM